jgi:hypothetical protein
MNVGAVATEFFRTQDVLHYCRENRPRAQPRQDPSVLATFPQRVIS